MRLDDAIRKTGFRRWYERQLIEGHAYLVTGFLSLIMMAIALETIEFRSSLVNLLALALVAAAGGGIALFSWKRFNGLLFRAEAVAAQATCSQCRSYGLFDVVDARDSSDSITGRKLTVRCRRCAHQWTLG
jgi:hypothetical protein